jgi:hypothetical protein
MSEARILGIDFSGGAGPWKEKCAKPTVWIAELEGFRLEELRPVQALPGEGAPFDRLVAMLKAGRFRAAGIDAPFSLPAAQMPGSHAELLRHVSQMPLGEGKPFPDGDALFDFAQKQQAFDPARKQLRETEKTCGAAARSTLWNGSRPGTPFTAACLTLLARAQRPIWPWTDAHGMLVECFPMAQLKAWGLPSTKYGPPDREANESEHAERRATRKAILAGIRKRVDLDVSREHAAIMHDSPDALDAVVAAFGARAAANRQLVRDRPESWRLEGAIAVHA